MQLRTGVKTDTRAQHSTHRTGTSDFAALPHGDAGRGRGGVRSYETVARARAASLSRAEAPYTPRQKVTRLVPDPVP